MQQTCSHCSSMSVRSKRRVLEKYFLKRICQIFLILKCRGSESRSVHFWGTCEKRTATQCQILIFPACQNSFFFRKSPLRSGSLFASTLKVHRPRPQSPLHFDIKVGLGISRTIADSQWNPLYNAFHRNFCCGNETMRQ